MINKIKMIFLVAVLAFCHLDAVPVQIFDYRGEPIAGEAGMLPDAGPNPDEQLLQEGFYYLGANGNMIKIMVNNVPAEGDVVFFILNADQIPENRTYVRIDSLENQMVRNKINAVRANEAITRRIENLKLCVALHAEEWLRLHEINFNVSRQRADMVNIAFGRLAELSAENYENFIINVGRNVGNIDALNNYITMVTNKYMTLRICFHRDRANGNANTAIRHLLIDPTDLFLPEEKAVMNRFRDDYFIPHITKHFCYSGLIDSHFKGFPLNQFPADIAHPEPKLHTTLSYDMGNGNNTFQTANRIARDVYPMILNMLLASCRFAFIIEGLRFTIEPNSGNGLKVEGGYVSFGKIGNHMRNFDYNGVIPVIFIRERNDKGEIEHNSAKENEKFSIFFNIGADLGANNAELTVDGTLFPSVNANS